MCEFFKILQSLKSLFIGINFTLFNAKKGNVTEDMIFDIFILYYMTHTPTLVDTIIFLTLPFFDFRNSPKITPRNVKNAVLGQKYALQADKFSYY